MKSLNTLIGILILSGFISFGQDNSSVAVPSPKTSAFSEVFPSMDIYAASTLKCGSWGLGFGWFAKPMLLSGVKNVHPVKLCLGVDAYFLRMQRRDLGYVPFNTAPTGEANLTLSQSNFGVNAVARFLVTSTPKITPYVDLFIGARGFSSDAKYNCTNDHTGKAENTSQNLSSELQLNYGASAGILYAINKNTKLNFGLMFTSSETSGTIDNIKNATYKNGTVVTDKMNTPKNTCIVKLGITFDLHTHKSRIAYDPSNSVNTKDYKDLEGTKKYESSESSVDDYYTPGSTDNYYIPKSTDINSYPKNTHNEFSRKIHWNEVIWSTLFEIAIGSIFSGGSCGGSGGGVSK